MLIAARASFAISRAKRWTNPYVTDGLIAWWDGVWNAGPGVHDPNATTWKDLAGGVEAYASTSGAMFSFAQNVCQCNLSSIGNGSGVLVAYLSGDVGLSVRQIDVVYSASSNSAPLCLSGVSSRQFICANVGGLAGQVGYTQFGATNLSATQLHAYSIVLTGGWPIMSAAFADGQSLGISGYKTTIDQYQPYSQGRIFLGYRGSKGGVLNLANVRLYSRARTAAEIAANYAIDKARFNLS